MYWLISLFTTFILVRTSHSHMETSQLLMISFDGFRWDYLQLAAKHNRSTPNFNKLISEGITVEPGGTKNLFITKTFPNHYSLVTGLYEEEHGIIANQFYDPVFKATFQLGSPEERELRFWNGTKNFTVEPIWVSNEKMPVSPLEEKRASGVFYWPGSEVPGQQPKFFRDYNDTVDFRTRADTVVGWLTSHKEPVNLALLYYHEPDKTGHMFGPNSPQMMDKIVELDNYLGYLLDKLKARGLYDSLDLIITSDHGMASISKSIYIDDYVTADKFDSYGATPIWGIIPKEGNFDEVLSGLQKIENLKVYKKADIPDRYHYRNNRRITPILIEANPEHRLCLRSRQDSCSDQGNHGFDNDNQEMHPIFIAHGKSFRRNFTAKSFQSVDVYPLICHLLEITPRPNNGSLDAVRPMLKSSKHGGGHADDGDDDDDGHKMLSALYESSNFFISRIAEYQMMQQKSLSLNGQVICNVCLQIGSGVCKTATVNCYCDDVLVFGFVSCLSLLWCVFTIRAYTVIRTRSTVSWDRLSNTSLSLTDNNKQPLLVSEDEEDIA